MHLENKFTIFTRLKKDPVDEQSFHMLTAVLQHLAKNVENKQTKRIYERSIYLTFSRHVHV